MTQQIGNDHPGRIDIYTTDPHDPFASFTSTEQYFVWLTELVRRKEVLRPAIGNTVAHIFPEHITAITFKPTKENS